MFPRSASGRDPASRRPGVPHVRRTARHGTPATARAAADYVLPLFTALISVLNMNSFSNDSVRATSPDFELSVHSFWRGFTHYPHHLILN